MSFRGGAEPIHAFEEDNFALSETAKEWFTAAELAALRLPGLPADKSGVNRRARQESWSLRTGLGNMPLARERQGRGGGMEFHFSVLSPAARVDMVRRGFITKPEKPEATKVRSGWAWYERQNRKTKAEAHRRMAVLEEVEQMIDGGMTVSAAVACAAAMHKVSGSTLYNWRASVNGVERDSWLPALAPRRKGGGAEVEIDDAVWKQFLSDFLRAECPSLARCYGRTVRFAEANGLTVPSERTLRRRLHRELGGNFISYKRGGENELRRRIPEARRTVDHLHAMQIVNLDGHMFDLWVWPHAGAEKPVRPTMIAIQDVYSSMILAWCCDLSENSISTQIAFGNLFKQYGIPDAVLTDNGRAFASKVISGGQKTRFRNKIKEGEPTGVLTAVGINVKWALPFRGQSKPIERAFRDLCDSIARGPQCAGAYTGNSIANKPWNERERALDWDEFIAIVEEGVAEHNTRKGRTGRHYAGRSFAEVFAESYATAPIKKASPEQLRLALLTAEQKSVDLRTSEIQLYGNRYWDEALDGHRRKKVMVRFDPENLHSSIFVYDMQGRFIVEAENIRDHGFDTKQGAVDSAKRQKLVKRKMRELDQALALHDAAEVARNVPKAAMPEMPDAGVVQLIQYRNTAGSAVRKTELAEPSLPEPTSKVLSLMARMRPED